MMKRAMAIMLAAVMLLQPTMASAISWGALVEGLHSSGTGSYTSEDGETTAELNGDELTVTGGTVSDVDIGDEDMGNKYIFKDVVIDGEAFRVWMKDDQAEIVLDGETEMNVSVVRMDVHDGTGLAAPDASIKMTVGENAAINAGEEVSLYIVGGSGELINNGEINADWVSVRAFDGGEVSGENNGDMKVDWQFAIGAESINEANGEYGEAASAEFVNNGTVYGDGWQDEEGNEYRNELHMFSRGDSQVSVTNNGTVDADMPLTGGNGNWDGQRENTAPDDAKYTMEFTNNGEVNGIVNVSVWENGNTTTTNNGTVAEMATDANEAGSSSTLVNTGSANSIFAAADHGTVGVEHSGTTDYLGGYTNGDAQSTINVNKDGVVTGELWYDAYDESSVTISNSGTVEGVLGAGALGESSLTVENKGTVGDKIYTDSLDNAEVTLTNSGSAEGIWVSAVGESQLTAMNNGTVNGEFGGGGYEGGTLNIANNGESGSAWIDAYDNANVTYENNGTVTEEISMGTNGGASLTVSSGEEATDGGKAAYIFLEEGETLTKEQIAQIMANANLPEDTVIATVDSEGEITGEYEIAEDGTVKELGAEAEPAYEPYDEEKIYAEMRAADEALRQSRAVGGVTTSIFWNKQMYLGHSTYNGRVYYQGNAVLTLQSLSWLPGGAAEGKNFTLRINETDVNPAEVEIRLAQDILDVCKRAGVTMITIADKNGTPIAQYAVADLIAAREMYGLAAEELICISADANAEVMKVTLEGEYLPIEPETETQINAGA